MFHSPLFRSGYRAAYLSAALLALTIGLLAVVPARTHAEPPEPNVPTIIGGREADPGEWPWQVALIYAGGDLYWDQFCGGSLIDAQWVLTAAHCAAITDASGLQVVAGIHDLVVPDPNYQVLDVAQILIHPDYGIATQYDSDIALLRLATPADIRPGGETVLPIERVRIVGEDVGPLAGVEATATGWGMSDLWTNTYPARLREVELPIATQQACAEGYGGGITDTMLCAGPLEGGKDTCYGDSGGPLVIYDAGRAAWELAGVTSWGSGCAQPGLPGVYARVSKFSAWILGQTGIVYEPDFRVSVEPAAAAVCAGTPAQFVVTVAPRLGFAEPVTLHALNLPPAASARFNPATLTPPGTSALTINTAGVAGGTYQVQARGTAPGLEHAAGLALTVSAGQPAAPQLVEPAANAADVDVHTAFTWSAIPGALQYRLEVALDELFSHVIYSATVAGTSHKPDARLQGGTAYYWRVTAENACGRTTSLPFRLITQVMYCHTVNLPIPPDNVTASDVMVLDEPGIVDDLNVYVRIDHTYVTDLWATLTYANSGESVLLLHRPAYGLFCEQRTNIDATIADEGMAPQDLACQTEPPAIRGSIAPVGKLSSLSGLPLAGGWRLNVMDEVSLDEGTLVEWCLIPTLKPAFCDGVTAVPKAECEALDALYTATGGWQWDRNAGWLSDKNPCNWYGVQCQNGHVVGLALANNGLMGGLRPQLSALSSLTTLELSGNPDLNAPLPLSLAGLALERFWFDDTGLCAPPDGRLAGWLASIADVRGSGEACAVRYSPIIR